MNIVYPLPQEALMVLSIVKRDVPDAIIAGGCLRDSILGRTINDIDIFVPDERTHEAIAAIRDTGRVLTKSIPEPYMTFNVYVRTVRYYEAPGLLPVNIIGVSGPCTPEAQLERFDFGICRVAYDGTRLWKDLSFDRDQRDQTFSLVVDQTEEQRKFSLKRFERLLEKYPGWRFVDRYKEDHWFED